MINDQFIKIRSFMMGKGLKLKNLDLYLYGLVFTYWENGREMYQSCSSIAKTTGYSREAVSRSLNKLVKEKYIDRLPAKEPFGNVHYTINKITLDEKVPAWRDDKSLEGCDKKSQGGVIKSHRGCDKKSQGGVIKNHRGCDKKSHQNKKDNIYEKKGDNIMSPLPFNCSEDERCIELWNSLMTSKKWADRSPEILAESVSVLSQQPVEVCRLMLEHTVSGDYAKIYPPTEEMRREAKIESPGCAKKSHLTEHDSDGMKQFDGEIFKNLHDYIPNELKDTIYSGNDGRALKFRRREGNVVISCPPNIEDWLNSIPDCLNSILKECVGPSYSGYRFDN